MDVRCERCNTEYEFDDALVSGRGTTVKCTNCGHKFKIRRPDADFAEDYWNVQTADGRTLVFTSLRELQRAIQTQLVDRGDQLSRGGLPPKPIGQIPELSPFFDQREARYTLPPALSRELSESATSKSARPPPPPGAAPANPTPPPPRQRQSTRPDFPPPAPVPGIAPGKKTLAGTGPEAPPVPAEPPAAASEVVPPPPAMRSRMGSTRPAEPEHEAAPTPGPDLTKTAPMIGAPGAAPARPRSIPPPLPAAAKSTAPPKPAPTVEVSSPLPPPTVPVRRVADEEDGRPPSPSIPEAPPSLGRRRSVGGYVVAAVVALGVGLLGAVWARDNLGARLGAPKPAVSAVDPRVAAFLATGERALADGNLELAKESFDKASALDEKEPRVLLAVARLAAARADVLWLKSRLLPANAEDEHRLTREGLAERADAARKAADDALAVAPDDPAALRAKIDALRISGDREGARAMVGRLGPASAQPETAYVLAALDLAEVDPLWSTMIERLRLAAGAEPGPGRARAALVYALARSGDPEGAKAEVERLAAMPRQHPLLPLLRDVAGRAPAAKPDAGSADAAAASAAASASTSAAEPDRPGGEKPGDKPARIPNDPRVLVAQGDAARGKGDYERARMLYSAALDRNPNDSEALHGLAAISHAQHDLNGARASYKRVLSINPVYLPALVGLGDVDWDSGDRASATKTYKEIVDRFPEGSYPPRVKQRLEASNTAPPPTPAPTATSVPGPDPGDDSQ